MGGTSGAAAGRHPHRCCAPLGTPRTAPLHHAFPCTRTLGACASLKSVVGCNSLASKRNKILCAESTATSFEPCECADDIRCSLCSTLVFPAKILGSVAKRAVSFFRGETCRRAILLKNGRTLESFASKGESGRCVCVRSRRGLARVTVGLVCGGARGIRNHALLCHLPSCTLGI